MSDAADDPPRDRLTAIQAGVPGVGNALARAGLRVLSWGWGAVQACKRGAYAVGLRRAHDVGVPVISVGNLVAGGTGKTPFVAWLCAALRAEGRRPGILARGYGDALAHHEGLNDEGAVLRHVLGPDVPQAQAPDRTQAAARLRAAHPGVDVLALDDGFQHRRVVRAVDIVLLDATRPFGFGYLLPRGLLREAPEALGRADAVVITRTERVAQAVLDDVAARIRAIRDLPIAHARAVPTPTRSLADQRVFAVCGIGNPDAFLGTLADLGATVVGRRVLGDHQPLPAGGWTTVLAEARAAGAAWVATTRKDAVKTPDLPPEVVVVDQVLEVHHGREELLAVVRAALESP